MNLFTYGTLMYPAVWRRVAGRSFANQPATLAGYAVYRVDGDVYPVLVACDQSAPATGVIYFDVDEQTLSRLDRYESEIYARQPVQATLPDGRDIPCETYLLSPQRQQLATRQPWTAEWFEEHALQAYLDRF